MKKKIGSDIPQLKWTLNAGGMAYNWADLIDLKVVARQSKRPDNSISPARTIKNGNELELYFNAADLELGRYYLEASFSFSDVTAPTGAVKSPIDWTDAFEIVQHSYQEDTEGSEFTTDIKFGVNGLSAYEAYKKYCIIEGIDYLSETEYLLSPAAAYQAALDVAEYIATHNNSETAHSGLFATKEAAGTAQSKVTEHNSSEEAHSGLLAAKENIGVAAGLVSQIIDSAPVAGNTLKKLNDRLNAIESLAGDGSGDENNLIDKLREVLAFFAGMEEGSEVLDILAAKVSVTDIYNALDCIIEGKVLDAKQGKVLSDAISALNSAKASKTYVDEELLKKKPYQVGIASGNIAKFKPLVCVGYQNGLPLLKEDYYDINNNELVLFGISAESALSGEQVKVAEGIIDGIDTSNYTAFAPLYYYYYDCILTSQRHGYQEIIVGLVLNSDAANGKVLIHPAVSSILDSRNIFFRKGFDYDLSQNLSEVIDQLIGFIKQSNIYNLTCTTDANVELKEIPFPTVRLYGASSGLVYIKFTKGNTSKTIKIRQGGEGQPIFDVYVGGVKLQQGTLNLPENSYLLLGFNVYKEYYELISPVPAKNENWVGVIVDGSLSCTEPAPKSTVTAYKATELARTGNLQLHKFGQSRIFNAIYPAIVNRVSKTIEWRLDKNDFTKKEDGTASVPNWTIHNICMVYPTLYRRVTVLNPAVADCKYEIAYDIEPFEGATLFHEESFHGISDGQKDRTLNTLVQVISDDVRYRGGGNQAAWDAQSWRSQLGMPCTDTSRTNFEAYANAAGWETMNIYDWTMFHELAMLYFANTNIQLAFTSTLTPEGYPQGGLGDGNTTWISKRWSGKNSYYPVDKVGEGSMSVGCNVGVKSKTVRDYYIGVTTSIAANKAIGTAEFSASNGWLAAYIGYTINNLTTGQSATIVAKDSDDQLSLSADIFTATNQIFQIVGSTFTYSIPVFFGLENLYGHLWKFCSGINFMIQAADSGGKSLAYVNPVWATRSAVNVDAYTLIGEIPRADGYIKSLITGWNVPKNTTGGGSTSYMSDYLYQAVPANGVSLRALLVSGTAYHVTYAGLRIATSHYAPSYAYPYIGARLRAKKV